MKIDDRVVNTNSAYNDSKFVFSLVNSIGSRLQWDEQRIRAVAQPVAKEGTRVHFDYEMKGGTAGYEIIKSIDVEELGSRAAEGSLQLLTAEKAPSGKMTVVLDESIAGLIAHEVCGHASEADEVVKKRSFLTGMVGKEIGSELVTMVDDATLAGPSGSYPFDSEGTPSSRTVIIEDGVFRGYMHTLETASLMGVAPSGNGRSQDYNRRVFARMSNTFFDKGSWKNDEIISDTKEGLFVAKTHSGMEDVVGGGVQATALKGYIIKNGEKTTLVRTMALAGRVLDILRTVDAVGDTLAFDGGNCGKGEEDWIPVSSGGPHMRAEMMVGGG
jgi:TldD protein